MTFDHRWRGLLWLAPLTIVLGGALAAAEWRFQVPTGWVDLSAGNPVPPGMPASELALAQCALRKIVEKEIDRSNATVPGDDKIGSRVGWRFAGSARYPSNPSGIT